MKDNSDYLYQCGGLSPAGWGALGSGASALMNGVAGIFETKSTNKTKQQIASSQNQNEQIIADLINKTNSEIAKGDDITKLSIAQIQANAEIRAVQIQADALRSQKQPISSAAVGLIFVGIVLIGGLAVVFKLRKSN